MPRRAAEAAAVGARPTRPARRVPAVLAPLSRWPVPALLTWCACWLAFSLLRRADAPGWAVLALPLALGAAAGLAGATAMRRAMVALGFPVLLLGTGLAPSAPAWLWLLPLALLALVYPLRAWRDAPLFPTPAGALTGLAAAVPLAPGARIVDAGCGLGDGLRELRAEYPQAQLEGHEWSRALALLCGWRCRFARIVRGDLWAADWSGADLVYLFQRPESMARAWEKAQREMRWGSWLVSLAFEVPDAVPTARIGCVSGRPVFLYRIGPQRR